MVKQIATGFWKRWEETNRRFGAQFMAACLLISALTLIGIFVELRTNNAQSAQQRHDQLVAVAKTNKLVTCFDGAFNQLVTGQPKVRKASQARNEAVSADISAAHEALFGQTNSLRTLFLDLLTNPGPEDQARIRAEFAAITVKMNKTQKMDEIRIKADANLKKVLAENPYPKDPAKHCDLSVTDKDLRSVTTR